MKRSEVVKIMYKVWFSMPMSEHTGLDIMDAILTAQEKAGMLAPGYQKKIAARSFFQDVIMETYYNVHEWEPEASE